MANRHSGSGDGIQGFGMAESGDSVCPIPTSRVTDKDSIAFHENLYNAIAKSPSTPDLFFILSEIS